MSKYTRHHYIFAKLVSTLQDNIQHSCYLIDTYPDDPRTDFELSMLNTYEKLYNLLTGSDDVTLLQEDYEAMLRVVQECKGLQTTKKGFQKIVPNELNEPEQPIVIAQTQISTAPELITEEELHRLNMEEIPTVPKKKKKVKTT